MYILFFFFNDTATTEIYTLSLHDALPILRRRPRRRPATGPGGAAREGLRSAPGGGRGARRARPPAGRRWRERRPGDRKSTRLNSSHANISYAVFCLKKKTHPPKLHTILCS